jgi:signal transduction histidine kinase/integral membrane sensor domain MASE1
MKTILPIGANSKVTFHADAQPHEQATFCLRTVFWILVGAACYYLATKAAWGLCFPDSKVSLFFPPHAVLVAILLLVPTRHWWAYTLAAACSHYIATQEVHWPPLYALHCEIFDAVKSVLVAAGIRWFIKSPFHLITLREAILFVLIAVIIVPVGTAFWGAAFTISNHFGAYYWIEWRNLSISNGVAAIVLVPVMLISSHHLFTKGGKVAPMRSLEAFALAVAIIVVGYIAFDRLPAGPTTSPALLYTPIPLLIWAALRFGFGGISASMLVITVLAIWGAMLGRGPFLTQTPQENAVALQLFILMAATPLMLLAVAIDDERRLKEAPHISEEHLSLAVECAQLALWDCDVVRDRVWMTDEGRKFFDFAPGEPIRISDLINLGGRVHPEDSAARTKAIQHTLKMGGAYDAEYRILLRDGSVRWVATRGRPSVAVNGTPRRLLGVSMDITRQKQATADAQIQGEELAHLSRAATLHVLSCSLAHELSQPLYSILINAQTGQRFLAQEKPDLAELQAIFTDIVSADQRAAEIIERMRTMLRRGEVALQSVSVNESFEELLHLIRSDLITRGVSVFNLITADLPPTLTDRVQLQQVLLNLIVNACDAMESNPPQDRHLTLTAFVVHNEMRIGVLDDGVGLPDDVEALFRPFYTTKRGGLGMGLTICHKLVTAHGGRLWAERRAERGAAFYVALPLTKADT